MVAFHLPKPEADALAWLKARIQPGDALPQVVSLCLAAWQGMMEEKPFAELAPPQEPLLAIAGKTVEAALLDRVRGGPVHYRELQLG
jgi:hypothetical protein